MKIRSTVMLMTGLAITACGGEEAPAAPPTDEEALAARTAEFVEAYNAHDAAAVAALYAEDATRLNADHAMDEGRAAIQARLAEQFAASPTLDLQTDETMIFGDWAVTHGTYAVNAEGASNGGHYLTVLQRSESGEWSGTVSITNRDSPMPDDGVYAPMPSEERPEEGMMQELVEAYELHYNLGHAGMVADLYADNAMVAFADVPPSVGRAEIEAELQRRIDAGAGTLDISDVGSLDLGDGWMMDGGHYSVTADDGTVVRQGFYMSLVDNGKMHWAVTN